MGLGHLLDEATRHAEADVAAMLSAVVRAMSDDHADDLCLLGARRLGRRRQRPRGDSMTAKAEFNAEEWATVVGAPLLTAMMVIAADRGGSVRESVAVAKAYAAAREQHEGEFMSALLATPPAAATTRPAKAEELHDSAIASLHEALAILERVGTEDEVIEFKRFVFSLAETVARAHKEGGFSASAAPRSARPSRPRSTRSPRSSTRPPPPAAA